MPAISWQVKALQVWQLFALVGPDCSTSRISRLCWHQEECGALCTVATCCSSLGAMRTCFPCLPAANQGVRLTVKPLGTALCMAMSCSDATSACRWGGGASGVGSLVRSDCNQLPPVLPNLLPPACQLRVGLLSASMILGALSAVAVDLWICSLAGFISMLLGMGLLERHGFGESCPWCHRALPMPVCVTQASAGWL